MKEMPPIDANIFLRVYAFDSEMCEVIILSPGTDIEGGSCDLFKCTPWALTRRKLGKPRAILGSRVRRVADKSPMIGRKINSFIDI